MAIITPVIVAVAVILVLIGRYIVPTIWSMFTTPLRYIPGPPSASLIWGNLRVLADAENSDIQEQWTAQYGPTLAFRGFLGMWRLWTVDTRAINHILTHTTTYQKPEPARYHLSRILGPGLLIAEDEQHRNQRRILNPAFGPAQIREITEIFTEKSNQLRDLWLAEISKAGDAGIARVNAVKWLSRATLDIIGLAGFNYNFEALNPSGEVNELNAAFSVLFNPTGISRLLMFLQGMMPIFRAIRTDTSRKRDHAMEVMHRIGKKLIAEKKAAIRAEASQKGRGLERKDLADRDLLTLLIKANMATDVPESQRLSDDEVLAQVPTFLVAGHETTSTATTWCLYQLTQSPEVQCKLRDELLQIPTDTPTMDELNALPYLDMVVKETLRYYSPVPRSTRVTVQDDFIPVDTPFIDRKGRVCDHIRVKKGDFIFVPILAINQSKALWGEDANEFRPERWESVPDRASSVPGVWANQLTFLGGPHACIGYRFSLVETKALLFALVRAFEFELAVKPEQIKKKGEIVQRPILMDTLKPEMPLIIKAYRA